ncbi:unnamed protein product [Polarella glacialis]|uniref:SGNH domain-containing protein n=1 Tax=Polarella glacialis TaxID=89957 RepID=A0A813GNE3_POLGL|nr:unnamed protein product [Polarella glacialis]
MAGVSPQSQLNQFMSRGPIVRMGQMSYTLYLWHWPVLCLMSLIHDRGSLAYFTSSCAGFMLASVLTYNSVERFFRSWRPQRQSTVFILLSVSLGSSAFLLHKLGSPAMLGRFYLAEVPGDHLGALSRGKLMNGGHGNCECSLPGAGANASSDRACFKYNMDPTILAPDLQDVLYCDAEDNDSEARLHECTAPDPNAEHDAMPTLYLFGDSHAGHLVPGLGQAAQGKFHFRWYHRSGTGFEDPAYFARVLDMLEMQLRPGDVVSVSHGWWVPAHGQELHSLVSARHASLLLLGDTWCDKTDPDFRYDFECSPTLFLPQANHRAECKQPRSKVSKLGADVHRTFQQLAEQNKDIYYFDFNEHLCEEATCTPLIPNTEVLARIGCHLTAAGSFSLWPYFCNMLSANFLV